MGVFETVDRYPIIVMDADMIYYRELGPEHKKGMMLVCKNCFPINYPNNWYDNLLKRSQYTYTQGAFDGSTGELVGIIVGQTQSVSDAEDEVGTLLESLISDDDTVMYITIFGVLDSYRRLGIGSSLMERLLSHALNSASTRAIYLHVESTNNTAITFYERKGFCYFTTIFSYYHLEGNAANGVVYVMFINGGKRYPGGFKSWCKRYIKEGSIGQCFSKLYGNAFETVRSVFCDQEDNHA